MVEPAVSYKTKYGTIWKTEKEALKAEAEENIVYFAHDLRNAAKLNYIDNQVAKGIYENKEAIISVLLKYGTEGQKEDLKEIFNLV